MSQNRFFLFLVVSGTITVIVFALFAFSTSAQESNRLLDTMQEIRHGMSKEEVIEILGRKPGVYPGNSPSWIAKFAPEFEAGEYWVYNMGVSRNLLIYFDEQEKVVFNTWSPT